MTVSELLEAYPQLAEHDVYAALAYASDVFAKDEMIAD